MSVAPGWTVMETSGNQQREACLSRLHACPRRSLHSTPKKREGTMGCGKCAANGRSTPAASSCKPPSSGSPLSGELAGRRGTCRGRPGAPQSHPEPGLGRRGGAAQGQRRRQLPSCRRRSAGRCCWPQQRRAVQARDGLLGASRGPSKASGRLCQRTGGGGRCRRGALRMPDCALARVQLKEPQAGGAAGPHWQSKERRGTAHSGSLYCLWKVQCCSAYLTHRTSPLLIQQLPNDEHQQPS